MALAPLAIVMHAVIIGFGLWLFFLPDSFIQLQECLTRTVANEARTRRKKVIRGFGVTWLLLLVLFEAAPWLTKKYPPLSELPRDAKWQVAKGHYDGHPVILRANVSQKARI